MTPQEHRNKRFDEKYPSGCFNVEPHDRDNLKSHITSEVHITIERVEKWARGQASGEDGGQDEMVNLAQLLSFLSTLKK